LRKDGTVIDIECHGGMMNVGGQRVFVSLMLDITERTRAERETQANDRFGHLAGDEVLRAFGALLTRRARGGDVCCRYGGEEFLLVLPGMPAASAVARAEQLRRALAAAPIAYGRSQIAVTASFGIAVFPRAGWTAQELLASADSALYAAKTAGRNRVMPGRAQSSISH
jgi:diguanylate cyclase (GGDEF)-like protein